jgi:UDP-N-acetyl-D-galactosamine dehydrogenase
MLKKKITVNGAKVLVLGITFKENCPDVRNTRVVDIVHSLNEYGCNVDIYDPWADADEVRREYGLTVRGQITEVGGQNQSGVEPSSVVSSRSSGDGYAAVVLAVAHNEFKAMGAEAIRALVQPDGIIYDLKSVLPRDLVDARL